MSHCQCFGPFQLLGGRLAVPCSHHVNALPPTSRRALPALQLLHPNAPTQVHLALTGKPG